MDKRILGVIATPKQGNPISPEWIWCADNGCFGKGYPGDEGFLEWLGEMKPLSSNCIFATAPDVVGDAAATLKRSIPFLARIREIGFPAAFVGQDGQEDLPVPWDEFSVFFIGGTTEWKLGAAARKLAAKAKEQGKWVHMGRVNSRRRLRYADSIGCDSADGTYLVFGPDVNLPKLLSWLDEINTPVIDPLF